MRENTTLLRLVRLARVLRERKQAERRTAAAASLDAVDDRRMVLLGRLHELRRAVEALEHELLAAEREFVSDRRRS